MMFRKYSQILERKWEQVNWKDKMQAHFDEVYLGEIRCQMLKLIQEEEKLERQIEMTEKILKKLEGEER